MALTVTNTNTLNLLGILSRTEADQSTVLTQLSTGLRINTGKDDPAGLIALKNLEAEITAVDAAITNDQRTDAVLGVADAALGEIHSLLQEIESLVVASSSDANLSSAELSANQQQIDLAIESIDRIVRTTNFNGQNLLDGSGAIDATVTSSDAIGNLKVFTRSNLSSNLTVTVDVTTAAATASFSFGTFSTGTTGGSNSGTAEFAITGKLGTATVELASGLTAQSAATQINAAKDLTGVSAIQSGSGAARRLVLYSTETGSDAFVKVESLNDKFYLTASGSLSETTGKVSGTDAVGTINGSTFTADGQSVSFNLTGGISGSFILGTALGTGSSQFTINTTGGFTFQLGVDNTTKQTIGIDPLFSHNLGGTDVGGFLNELKSGSDADLSTAAKRELALKITRRAITDVATSQGRIGAFQKFQVQPSINSLTAAKTGLSEARSVIGDTDYALATAELNKQTVLLNSGISLLGLANQQAAQILSLLGAG